MIEFYLNVYIIPSLAMIVPFAILAVHISTNDLKLSLGRKKVIQFVLTWFLLATFVFLLLLYLTGDLAHFYFLETGVFHFSGGIQFNLTRHIGLTFRYDPGILLLAIAALSALLYTSLLVLPPNCTVNYTSDAQTKSTEGRGTAISSGLTSTVSAVASTAVCCSTSVIAVVAPAIVTLLGPFVDILFYFSVGLLIYSFVKIVLPRFPVV